MNKKILQYFQKKISPTVNERKLEKQTLEQLLILKDDERDYLSVKLPMFLDCLGTLVSVFIATQAKFNQRRGNNIILLIFSLVAVYFIGRLGKLFKEIDKNNRITEENLKIYKKVILKKLKEKEKSEKEYKEKITNLLEEIRDNTKQK